MVGLLPGLLMLQPGPAAAEPGASVAVTGGHNVVDLPEQARGAWGPLPPLVASAVTRSAADPGTPQGTAKAPKEAVPRETVDGLWRRQRLAAPVASSGSAVLAQVAAEAPCGNVQEWRANFSVSAGDRRHYNRVIYRAQLSLSGPANTTPPPQSLSAWASEGPCPLPPPPAVTQMSPDNRMQVMTTQPTLSTSATTWDGGSVGYDFEVCDGPDLTNCATGEDCCALSGSWTVPEGVLTWGRQYWWRVRVTDASTIGGQSAYSETRSFVVGVRQPAITSQLSTRGVNGQEFYQASGNYTTTFTDAQVSVAGPPLAVVRSYNSMDPRRDGAFGAGWSTRWDMRVAEEDVRGYAAALVTYPDGRHVRFAKKTDGGYQPPPGMFATLAKEADGSWRLMDKSATSYLFDSSGRLVKVSDQRGRSQLLVYGSDGKLGQVTAVGGRSLSFTWTGNHVGAVTTDAVDGQALTWTYTYNGDVLTKVCNPAQECTSYAHNPGSLYRSTVLDSDPMGYWRFGESFGSTAEDLGWIGDGHYNSDYTLGRPGALSGTTDTAVGIPASQTDAINLPAGIIPRAGKSGSVEAWFQTTGTGNIITVQGTWAYITNPLFQVTVTGRLSAAYHADSARLTSPAAVNDGAWHHAVLTAAGDLQTLYLDGVAVASQQGEITQTRPEYSEYMDIGGVAGSVDEVAVYDRPLSPAEIGRHFAARAEAPHKLTKITLPLGRVWADNSYDASTDRISSHVDSNGGRWQIGEPVDNRTTGMSTVTVTDPGNQTLTSVYDAWRGYRLVSQTDQLGHKTSYDYDTSGFVSNVTDPNNNSVSLTNDSRGNPLTVTTCRTASSCQTARNEYHVNEDNPFDQRNDRVTKIRDPRSAGATDNTYATTLEYNQYGEQTKQTTPATSDFPDGRSATVAYTDGTEPAIGGGITPAGLVSGRTDPRGNSWSYRYTVAGDLAEQTDPEGLVSRLGYDALGRLTSSSKVSDAFPNGVTTTFTYDALGRVATMTGAAVKNEITGVTHTARTTYGYDADGNTLSEAVSDLTGGDPERKVVYGYDAFGRVESVTDAEGGVTRQAWNTLGQKVSSTDARETVTAYTYTKRGELYTTTLKGWTGSPVNPQPATDVVLETLSYDPGGRLASRVDAMGRKTTYTYYADNRLSQTIGDDVKLNDPAATPRDVILEANTYDAAGNLTKQVTGGGKVTTAFVYDAANRLSSKTLDPSGLNRKTSFTYDANDNITKTASTGAASGTRTEVTEYVYNKVNLPTRETVENGEEDLVSTMGYDDRGLAVSMTDPRGNASGADAATYTTTVRYDELDRLVETVAPQVQIDKAGTSSPGRPTGKVGYDTVGNKTHQRDAEGRTSVSTFDKAGRLTSASAPQYTPPGGTAVTPTVSHAYDAAGLLLRTTDQRGQVTAFEYDQFGRQVRVTDPAPAGQTPGTWVIEYDLAGEKLATVDPTGARTQATYDDLGRQITATQIERKPASAAYTTTMEYDDAGRLVKQTAPGTKVTNLAVNAAGEVTTVTDPLTNTTTTDYDLAGRPVKTTDPNGNATTAEYDLAGRKTTTKDLNATGTVLRTFGYGFDPAGNPTSATSPEGHVTRRTFDALNRVTSLIEPVSAGESITTSFGYDATGARTRLTDGRGNATWTSYNSLGLAETVTEPSTTAHPNLADRTWTHAYDAAGNQTATLQPGGVRIDRTFDHLNRLTNESGIGGGAASAERTFGYDPADRLTTAGDLTITYNDRNLPLQITRGGSQETAYAYDALGNPTQRIDAAGTSTFTWDNANRLKTATDPVTGRTLTYGYDPASRLKTITTTTGQASTQSFDYDALDRLTGQTLKNGSGTQLASITYGWDKDDNLTTKTTTGTAGAGTNTYTYDHAGRLLSWTAPGGATTAYEWDAAGNRTKAGNATFTYDERNRLTSGDGTDYTHTPRGTLATSTKNGATTNYTFDAFDRLIADGDSLYSYDALDRVASRISGANKQMFAYSGLGNDLASVRDSGGAVQAAYARDPGGSLLGLKEGAGTGVAALSDLHGDLVATYTTTLQTSTAYDPFGAVLAQTGPQTQLGYQGEYTDPDTGKVNMHARWYQPGTGTFTSRDTATLNPSPSVQANRYTYANASPLTGADPTGHSTIPYGYGFSGGGLVLNLDPKLAAAGIYADLNSPYDGIYAPTYGEGHEIMPNTVMVMTVEQMKTRGHLPNGTQITADFWGLLKGDVDQIIEVAYLGATDAQIGILIEHAKLRWYEELVKSGRSAPAMGGADIKRATPTCSSYYGEKACKAIKEAAKIAKLTKEFLNECMSPAFPLNRCLELRDRLDISDKAWNELRGDFSKGKKGDWRKIVDFLVGDAVDCINGSVVGCGLFALNFLPLGGVASKALSGIAKTFGKVGKVGSAVAKACSSFVPGTLVLMADGSRKPIEDVRIGDEVLATDPTTGRTVAKKVTALINSSGTKYLVEITIRTEQPDETDTQSVIATAHHPFWVPSLQKWVDATYLQPGTWLRTSAGTWIQVADVKRWTAPQQVYNLTVADIHTYHVGVEDANILVHNASPCLDGWARIADFTNQSTLSKKYDAHAGDFGISGNRNKKNLDKFVTALRAHMTAPGTKIYRFNYRNQGLAVGFIDSASGKMVMLRTDGSFWTAYKLGSSQFSSIVDGFLW
ncbi:MAG TPA: polymorphic toxin-type HINT domain-containing protein [Nonomuraea sp.]|nr:polymorphic toxin-type HINT domain-containing protein [Nonomuraea sp.]